jgi:heme A synthase
MEEKEMEVQTPRNTKLWRGLFAVSGVLFGLYTLNVVAGKAAAKLGVALPFRLNDVGEFLVVLACMVCFVTAMLVREMTEAQAK